jgi:hypothetical protein
MKMNMFADTFGIPGLMDNPSIMMRQSLAICGLLIAAGELDYDEAISGEAALEKAEAYVKAKFAEMGITKDV